MTQITSHVLDTSRGRPAEAIEIKLFSVSNDSEQLLGTAVTNADGRVGDFTGSDSAFPAGVYKLSFALTDYFTGLGVDGFYPRADVVFKVAGDGQHYHVPLLLNPFGYSTYRGS